MHRRWPSARSQSSDLTTSTTRSTAAHAHTMQFGQHTKHTRSNTHTRTHAHTLTHSHASVYSAVTWAHARASFTAQSMLNRTDAGVPDIMANPYSWTRVANMLFIESPPSVGYSCVKPRPPLALHSQSIHRLCTLPPTTTAFSLTDNQVHPLTAQRCPIAPIIPTIAASLVTRTYTRAHTYARTRAHAHTHTNCQIL